MQEKLIEKTIEYVKELFRGNAGGHDAAHTLRVYKNAMQIADARKCCDFEAIALGALLHDADDYKLFNTENNENARRFLREMGCAEERIDEICMIANAVSFSKNKDNRPQTVEAMIVQDADRLDAIGAIGIARTFAFGGEHGRSIEDTVQHFYDKLLRLKDLMNTPEARVIAEQRHACMVHFLEELEAEI